MKLLIKSVIFGPALLIAAMGCASKSKDVQVVEKDTQPYLQVEAELQKPLTTTSADIKVLIERNHPDFKDLVFECNYAEKYLSDRSCSSKKLRGNKSMTVKCVAADDRSSPEMERGSCAKQICIDAQAKDCLLEGNTAISL